MSTVLSSPQLLFHLTALDLYNWIDQLDYPKTSENIDERKVDQLSDTAHRDMSNSNIASDLGRVFLTELSAPEKGFSLLILDSGSIVSNIYILAPA